MLRAFRSCCVCLVVVLGGGLGCGSNGPPLATVSGKVTTARKGLSLTGYRIAFETESGGGLGDVAADGKYVAEVPEGKARVAILPPVPPPGATPQSLPQNLSKYANPATSGLATTIAPGENEYNVDLK